MKLQKIILIGVAVILLLQTKSFPQSSQPIALIDTNALIQMVKDYAADLAANPPLSDKDFTNKMAALGSAYRNEKIGKGVAMAETFLLEDNQSQEFYGKVIDQYGQTVDGADVTGEIIRAFECKPEERKMFHLPTNDVYKTQTDNEGFFQFTGIRGWKFDVSLGKNGYQLGNDEARKGSAGQKTSPTNRTIFTMWKLRGPEPMIHGQKFYGITPDWRMFTIDLENHKKIEGTNIDGDLLVQIERPPQIKPREKFDWSFVMTAINGGFIEITNAGYLNEAPESGYDQQYKINMLSSDPKWQGWQIEKTFYLKSRSGQVYGHFHLEIIPDYNDTSALNIEYYINPSGSRNLEWDGKIQVYKLGDKFLPVLRPLRNKVSVSP
jgi:hypothetical protein